MLPQMGVIKVIFRPTLGFCFFLPKNVVNKNPLFVCFLEGKWHAYNCYLKGESSHVISKTGDELECVDIV